MQEITIVAGSTGDASITPGVDPDYPTTDAVTFEVHGTSVALTDTDGVWAGVIPHDIADPADGEQQWGGAFVITRSGADGQQISRVAVRVFVVLSGGYELLEQVTSFLRCEADDPTVPPLIRAAEGYLAGAGVTAPAAPDSSDGALYSLAVVLHVHAMYSGGEDKLGDSLTAIILQLRAG